MNADEREAAVAVNVFAALVGLVLIAAAIALAAILMLA